MHFWGSNFEVYPCSEMHFFEGAITLFLFMAVD